MKVFKKTIKIGSHVIGPGMPAYIVAEIGINHNGDIELAKDMILAANQAGVDAVKFQNYRTEDFLTDRRLTYRYISEGKEVEEPQFDMFKRCELSRENLVELISFCKFHKIDFHSTPTSIDGVNDLVDLGVNVLKNGSDYLVNLSLIEAMASTGLPVVLSTGMATLAEIDTAVQIFRESDNDQLLLLHCTSQYPTPPSEINITRIQTLASCFGVVTGFSDHSDGKTAAVLAAGLGASWIEKHFTLDKHLPGPDQRFSADPQQMASLVAGVREAGIMQGTSDIGPTENEMDNRMQFRLSCVAARDIEKGEILNKSDIVFQRPGDGIPPAQAHMLSGLAVKQLIPKGKVLLQEDFI